VNNEVFDKEFCRIVDSYNPAIPNIVLDRIDKTLASLNEEEIIKNNSNNKLLVIKILKRVSVAAVIALIVLTSSAVVSDTMAQALTKTPVISSVLKLFGDMGLKYASSKDLNSIVDKTVIDKDIKITINDILYDGTRISIGYTMEAKNIDELEKPDCLINGEPIDFSSSSYGNPLGENAYAGVLNINPTSKLPENSNLSLSFYKVGSTEGTWKFENIKVKDQSDSLNTKILIPMITKSLPIGTITIGKVFISESTIKLHVIESNLPQDANYGFQLIDNYGNVLAPAGGSGSGENNIMNMDFTFIPLNNNPKHFIVKVSDRSNRSDGSAIKDVKVDVTNNFPIALSQGEGGKISVNKIEYLDDKTLIHYTYSGNDPYGNGVCIWAEDEAGNKLRIPQIPVQRNIDGSCILTCSPMDKDKKIKVASRELPKLVNILEFQIPIK
jgi:hypothetical protein